jgi:hypothetical protein
MAGDAALPYAVARMTAVTEQAAPSPPGRRALRSIGAQAHLALPAALTAALAFQAGGYFPGTVAALAVVLVLLVIGRLTLAARPLGGWSLPLALSVGALGLLTAWTLFSATWSEAPLRAMLEFDRTLAYLLVLALMGSFATRAGDLDRVLRWLALIIGAIAVAALITRLFPASFPVQPGRIPSRLAFPLTYWNALGILCAVGLVLALHCSAGAGQGRVTRILAAGAVPILCVCVYLTLSRGAILAGAIGVLAYVVLAHPRRVLPALVATVVPAALAVRSAYGAGELTSKDFASAVDQGREVALVLVACVVAAMALRALGLLADRRLDAIHVSRRTRHRLLGGAAAAGLLLLAVSLLATDLPDRLDDQRRAFVRAGAIPNTDDARDRLTQVGANGRIEHWRVSLGSFEESPLTGSGAGTYRLEWERERDTDFSIVDGHSLYLEVLGELGLPGLLLLGMALLVPLGVAARRLFGPERHGHAAFLAAGLALLIHAGVDWDWEMPAVFVGFLGAAGVVCAARLRPAGGPELGRLPRVVGGLACLLLAVTPATVAMSQTPLNAATRAFKAGDCAATTDKALDSLEALSARPEPFELLGYCNLRAGQRKLGLDAMRAARARDPGGWQYAYGVAIAQAFNGDDPRAMAAEARRLNPFDARARAFEQALRESGPRRWPRAAARAEVPFE